MRGHLEGFDLHAAVAVHADDREGLERLCRYLARPAVARDRLALLSCGRVRVELEHPWRDGTTHLDFEPLDFSGRLAAFVPRPRTNLVLYHGALAPNAPSAGQSSATAAMSPARATLLASKSAPYAAATASAAHGPT